MLMRDEQALSIGIIEDEFTIGEFLKFEIAKNGHTVVFIVDNGADALESIKTFAPEILFVDINIRGAMDGITLVKELRKIDKSPLVAYITAYSDTDTIQELSETLPEAFLKKPFCGDDIRIALMLLSKKISSIRQKERVAPHKKGKVQVAQDYAFDTENQELFFKESAVVDLTQKERALLSLLARKVNITVSKEELMYEVWGGEEISETTIRDLVYKIRKKIEGIDIKTVSSYGYRLRSY